jgi:drug/metabolite transporter (DMT)-like permease
VHGNPWMAFGNLVTVGSILTYMCYLWLLKVRPAAQVSSYVYVNPVVAIILGAVIGKESITFLQIVSLAIILLGVLLINLPKYRTSGAKQLSVI